MSENHAMGEWRAQGVRAGVQQGEQVFATDSTGLPVGWVQGDGPSLMDDTV